TLRMENPYEQPQNGCILCNITVYFKNVQVCGKKQGFMSVTHKDPHFMKDPNIFDIRHLE
ncbi:unnamed protein product, partial [Coregonus sp. 'balchen']